MVKFTEMRDVIAVIALLYPFLVFLFMPPSLAMSLFTFSALFGLPAYVLVFIMHNEEAKCLWIPLGVNYVFSFSYIAFLIWDMFFGVAASCGIVSHLNTHTLSVLESLIYSGIITIFSYPGLPLSIFSLYVVKHKNKVEIMVSLLRVVLFFVVLSIAGVML